MSSLRVVRNAARIPKADIKAAEILAEMFRSVMDEEEEEELGEEDVAAYSSMLEGESGKEAGEGGTFAVIEYVVPSENLVEVGDEKPAVTAVYEPTIKRDDEHFFVKSVDDIRFKSNRPVFSVAWADGTLDWRRFEELAEKEEGELVVNEKLQEFLDRRGLVDANTFYNILKKKKKFTISDFKSKAVKLEKEQQIVSKAINVAEADRAVEDLEIKEEEGRLAEEVVDAGLFSEIMNRDTGSRNDKVEKEVREEGVKTPLFTDLEGGAVLRGDLGVEEAPKGSSSIIRKMNAVKAFVDEVANRTAIKTIIEVAESMHLSRLELARVILYQECRHFTRSPYYDICEGPLSYRFVLDTINKAIGEPIGSPIAMSLRGRQNTCSESLSSKTTSKDIPTIGSKLRTGITYNERSAEFLKDKTELFRHLDGLIERTNSGLTALNEATPLLRQKMLKAVDKYSKDFSESRPDARFAFFGIGKDLDPTLVPTNLGDKARKDIYEISSKIVYKHTSLKDESGALFPFYGAFWEGKDPLSSGTKLGYYEGRIVTECDNTETHADAQSEYSLEITKFNILVDASIASESNWARYINDGSHGQTEDLTNVRFAKDGSVIATRTIHVGDELFVRYGNDYWRFFV